MTAAPIPLSLEQRTAVIGRKLRTWKNPITYRLTEPVDVDALSAALATVCARHDPLRLRMVAPDDERQWFAEPAHRLKLDTVDCADEAAADAVTEEFFGTDIDLVRDGPIRPVLLRVQGGQTRLLIAVHHVAWDGLSTTPFNRDLWESYRAHRHGHEPELPTLPTDYRSYVLDQEAVGTDFTVEQSRYWDGIFAGWHPDQGFGTPADHGEGRRRGWWNGARSAPPPALAIQARLRKLARTLRVTPPIVWLSATFVGLWYRHHADAVCVYSVHHGRDRAELFDLVGYFSRSIPLRATLRPEDRFADLCVALFEQNRSAIRQSAAPWTIIGLADRVVGPRPETPPGQPRVKRPRMSRVTVNIQVSDADPAPDGDRVADFVAYDPERDRSWTPRPGQLWLQLTLGRQPSAQAEYDRRRFPDALAADYLNATNAVAAAIAQRGVGLTLGELRTLLIDRDPA